MNMRYDFEWDVSKAKANIRRHSVSFERAATIFRDPNLLSIPDEEHSESEERWITMGLDESGSLLVLSHKFETGSEEVSKIHFRQKSNETRNQAI